MVTVVTTYTVVCHSLTASLMRGRQKNETITVQKLQVGFYTFLNRQQQKALLVTHIYYLFNFLVGLCDEGDLISYRALSLPVSRFGTEISLKSVEAWVCVPCILVGFERKPSVL